MERSSFAYQMRRKIQVLASKILTNEAMSKIYFRALMGQKLNLQTPKTFNEKLQWLKLYYMPQNPLVVRCADKYTVRGYIEEMGYGDKLVPIFGVWDNAQNININELPRQFVLKCTHGCAYNIVVSAKENCNWMKIKKKLNRWLKEDFGAYNIEPHYSQIPVHRITCEKFLGDCITDYKFFCFNGVPKYIYVSSDLIHDRQARIGFFYLDGSPMPLHRDDYIVIPSIKFPPFFEEMKEMATRLAQPFPFVRVDFFVAHNQYYFAELTFTPGACMMPFNPKQFDLDWGNELDLTQQFTEYNFRN